MAEYDVKDYELFMQGSSTANTMKKNITDSKESLSNNKAKLGSDSVFMGPLADSCVEALASLGARLTSLGEGYANISDVLQKISASYKSGDEKAAKEIMAASGISIGSVGGVAGSASDLPTVSVSDVQNCQSVEEYLDLVMPLYSYYCKQYGIKYPGVLALQPVHEHSAPTGIQAQSAVVDNNLGGLKYAEGIPNATPGSIPTDGTGGIYSHFDNVNQYVEAACWNIAHEGGYYGDAMAQNNMADFTTSMVNTWVGHPDNYGSSIVSEYQQYGLDKYEL